ncbi:MAG: hypothetical protein M1812_006810 [Candelaria pacifica]|nr:MAG: hypothetical protein M1812_006810 [Candelaria pacifica]
MTLTPPIFNPLQSHNPKSPMQAPREIRTTSPITPSQIHQKLTNFLTAHLHQQFSIEILPSNFPNTSNGQSLILEEGPNLGLTKKTLIQAFLLSRHQFFKTLTEKPLQDTQEIYTPEILTFTSTILIFSPEHTTAINHRKKHLLKLRSSPSPTTNKPDLSKAIQTELIFLASLQTSPLHRHTKSPTLWHHRYWLASEFPSYFRHAVSAGKDWDEVYITELTLVMKAGERHPKNYYAWDYARRLFRIFKHQEQVSSQNAVLKRIIRESISIIHGWCLSHADDISGWGFLIYLISYSSDNMEIIVQTLRRTLDLAFSFQWSHESLWVFVRTLLASKTYISSSQRRILLQDMRAQLEKSTSEGFNGDDLAHQVDSWTLSQERVRDVLGRTIEWIELNWEDEDF